ncbi:MAG: efflux RND transporter periplasmic adaptor subunit [Candidatus Omnitrophica bacterium]|nr:efflux RND transporter periplasmic adaptor subunit [Candidatus Omnitrophota bacterium]
MSNKDLPVEPGAQSTAREKPVSENTARVTVITVVIIVTVAAILVGVPWLFYRYQHVVISAASIKGRITRLGARIDGQVKSILVDVGQRVTKGQVLLRLEDQHLQAQLQEEQAELKSATNELISEKLAIAEERRSLKLEVDRAEAMRKSAFAALEGAKSTAEKFDKEYVRLSALMKDGIASSSDLDTLNGNRGKAAADVSAAKGMCDATESSYQSARVQLDALKVREARLAVLEANVALARGKTAAAEADLAATVIRAPEDGWVVDRIVELGGSARVGEPLMSLWIGHPWIEAWVSEKDLSRFTVGSYVDVSVTAFPGQTLRGRVATFGLLTDTELQNKPVPSTLDALIQKSALVPIRIDLDNEKLRLQPGLTAVVGIEKRDADRMPGEATLFSRIFSEAITLASSPFKDW